MIDEAKIENLLAELRMSEDDANRIKAYLAGEGIELVYSALGITWRRTLP